MSSPLMRRPGIPTGTAMAPRLCALLAVLALFAPAPGTIPRAYAHAGESAEATATEWWAGPAVSGSWFDPARSGEGVIVQFLPDGSANAFWFTYPPAGEAGAQAWMVGQGGVVDGDTLRFDTVYRPLGARFGEQFDPADVDLVPWGTMEMQFADCGNATLRYAGPPAFGAGEQTLVRLTEIDEVDCAGASRDLLASGARAPSGLRSRSGAWFVPSRSGEGWIVEELTSGYTAVIWFTFSPDGHQAWTIGVGERIGDRVVIADNRIAGGTRFGAAFDAADVELPPWGTLELHFEDCGNARVSYRSVLPGFGAAVRDSERLVSLGGQACLDALPGAAASGSWSEHATMPGPPQSEHDLAVAEGRFYVLGGFGDPRGFKRYDPAANAWSVLSPLPAGRDHPSAFAIDGGVYLVGGAHSGGGDQSHAAYRYDLASGTWAPVPELGDGYGSRAAVLNGHAWVGNANGNLQQFDPLHRRVRRIDDYDGPYRDHGQVLAFLGEIWLLGGRMPDTGRVSIYDPASGLWREGPPMQRKRGGFAAAVVDQRIVVGGGEVLRPGVYVERSSESYAAGSEGWVLGPNLPLPVHGTAGAAHDGRFYVVAGSTVGASSEGQTGRVFSLRLQP